MPSGYPLEVTNTSTTARSAVISWDPPDEEDQNGFITSYTVKIVEAGTEETLQRISSTTSITATSLKPYTSYSVSVAASTSVGNGPFSISITLRTNQDGKKMCHFYYNAYNADAFLSPNKPSTIH